jgi:hypothetical protein
MRRVVSLLLFALIMPACSGSDTAPNATSGTEDEAVKAGGAETSLGSCVEQYSPETLKKREVALDGVVTQITTNETPLEPGGETVSDYLVTVQVNEWFKGGSGSEATFRSSVPLAPGISVANESAQIQQGQRYLVSGDGGFMWSCGFTLPFTESAAADWKRAFE